MSIHKKHPNPRRVLKADPTLAIVASARTLCNVLLITLLALALIIVAGCAASPGSVLSEELSVGSDEPYQVGDVSAGIAERLMDRQAEYCATANPGRRAVLLTLIRVQVPTYPPSGLCSDVEQAVFERLAEEAAGLPPVDMDQAAEDQRRAQERLERERAQERLSQDPGSSDVSED